MGKKKEGNGEKEKEEQTCEDGGHECGEHEHHVVEEEASEVVVRLIRRIADTQVEKPHEEPEEYVRQQASPRQGLRTIHANPIIPYSICIFDIFLLFPLCVSLLFPFAFRYYSLCVYPYYSLCIFLLLPLQHFSMIAFEFFYAIHKRSTRTTCAEKKLDFQFKYLSGPLKIRHPKISQSLERVFY